MPTGESWYFDDTMDRYVTMADHAALTLPNTEWALGGWFRLPDGNVGTGFRMISSWGVYNTNPSWQVFIGEASCTTTSCRNNVYVRNGTTGYVSTYSITQGGRALTDWHYLLMTRQGGSSGTAFSIYVDACRICSGSYISGARDVAADWHWGVRQDLDTEWRFNGYLSEWAKWDRGLTLEEREYLALGVRPSEFSSGLAWYVPMNHLFAEDIVPLTLTSHDAVSSTEEPGLIAYSPAPIVADNLASVMTSNVSPAPSTCGALREEFTSSTSPWSGAAYFAFDSDTGSYWGGPHLPLTSDYQTAQNYLAQSLPTWIWFCFGAGNRKIVNSYTIRARIYDTTGAPKDWLLQGWTGTDAGWDGWSATSWVTLDTVTDQTGWTAGEERTFTFTNTFAYLAYRLYVTANNGKTYVLSGVGTGYLTQIAKIGFYYDGSQAAASTIQATAPYTMSYLNDNGTVWGIPLGDKVVIGPTAGVVRPKIRHNQMDNRLTWPSHPFKANWTVRSTNDAANGTFRLLEHTSRDCMHMLQTTSYNWGAATGNERFVRYITTAVGAGHMQADSKGNLYIGTGWDTTNGTMVVKIDARTGEKIYNAVAFPAGLSTTYIVRGMCLSKDERYLYVMGAPNGHGYVWKFDLTTGASVWATYMTYIGYDLAIDEEGNAYATQENARYLYKLAASDGTMELLWDTQVDTGIVGGPSYARAVDDTNEVVLWGGTQSCLTSDAVAVSRLCNLWATSTDGEELDSIVVGDLSTSGSLTSTPTIGTKNIKTHDGYIYIILIYSNRTSKLFKYRWTGTELEKVKEVPGPTDGCNLYFDVYGNLVVVQSNWAMRTDTSFAYYNTDLEPYSVELGLFSDLIAYNWNGYSWLRGDVVPNGILTGTSDDTETEGTAAEPGMGVNSVAVIPGQGEDEVWLVVARKVGGVMVRLLEQMQPRRVGTVDDQWFVDSGVEYTDAGQTLCLGLGHLEGYEVAILQDGVVCDTQVVAGGSITLTSPIVRKAIVGLPFRYTLKPMRFDLDKDGTTKGSLKRFAEMVISFFETLNAEYGEDTDSLFKIDWRTEETLGSPPELYTGDKLVTHEGGFSTEDPVVISGDDPVPCTVRALIPRVETTGR